MNRKPCFALFASEASLASGCRPGSPGCLSSQWGLSVIAHLKVGASLPFRFNRRKNDDLFADTLRRIIKAPVLTFDRLTKKSEKVA